MSTHPDEVDKTIEYIRGFEAGAALSQKEIESLKLQINKYIEKIEKVHKLNQALSYIRNQINHVVIPR